MTARVRLFIQLGILPDYGMGTVDKQSGSVKPTASFSGEQIDPIFT